MEVNPVQFSNGQYPNVTLQGNVISDKAVHPENACGPIDSMLSGRAIVCNEVHPEKACSPMLITSPSMVMEESPEQFINA